MVFGAALFYLSEISKYGFIADSYSYSFSNLLYLFLSKIERIVFDTSVLFWSLISLLYTSLLIFIFY